MSSVDYAVLAFAAGLAASVACGLGALPLAWRGLRPERDVGTAYAFAGGLMFSASVYNLLVPALADAGQGSVSVSAVCQTIAGLLLGCAGLWWVNRYLLSRQSPVGPTADHSRSAKLIFLAMTAHSVPEGLAVGVGYGAEAHAGPFEHLGWPLAIAITIHNIPEGLAVALPLRATGVSLWRCGVAAFLTSLPQPLAAVPAVFAVWLFKPLLLPLMGLAAGAMMFLVIVELIPDALETRTPTQTAWAFMLGFCAMLLVQIAI